MPSARLEIHQLNVGQGDCTIIVNRENVDVLEQRVMAAEQLVGYNNLPVHLAVNLAPSGYQEWTNKFNTWAPQNATIAPSTDLVTLGQSIRTAVDAIGKNNLPPGLNVSFSSIDHLPWAIAFNVWAEQQNIKPRVALFGTASHVLVVDFGDRCYGTAIKYYLQDIGALAPDPAPSAAPIFHDNISFLITHYHADHQDGLRSVLRTTPNREVFRIKYLYRLAAHSTRGQSQKMTDIMWDMRKQQGKPKTRVAYIQPGGLTKKSVQYQIYLGDGIDNIPITVKILASERAVGGPSGKLLVAGVGPEASMNPNDRSIALVVEYGSFRHFIGGDAGGAVGAASGGYADIETVLAGAMEQVLPASSSSAASGASKFRGDGHCCTMKVNHHGAMYSNDEAFFATLQPRVALISSGVRFQFHGHPTPDAIQRLTEAQWVKGKGKRANTLLTTDHGIFATEIALVDHGVAHDVDTQRLKILGDICIRPLDEDIAASVNATGFKRSIGIQVYGNGAQTPNLTKSTLRATCAVPAELIYPLGPFDLACDQH
jgi:hypothetical protein